MSAQAGAGLDPQMVAMVRVATAIARGDEGALRDRMRAARVLGVPGVWVEELLLQSFLNVGYPLALSAFGIWRELAGPPEKDAVGEPIAHAEWERWRQRGEEACAQVYGRTYHKLLLNLRALHPAIEPLVVVDAYGKILSRPGLDAKRRELCTLAAIAMLDAPRQLHAHLRGALNTGWTREDVDAVLAVVEADLTKERALKLWEMWADVRGRKLHGE
ncbi:MAG TPA: carboxymuconolactone decarboxylase family protein [Gemmatimonadales bacterium]|jgi:4-carboxymuconolactone decarboxylase|nr:carboxymuconolactone decarboxylase family protein [Gemmatimonadales bacterium]